MWPQVLPGSRAVLFTAARAAVTVDDASIEVVPVQTGATKVVARRGYYGRYLSSGHVVYAREGVLFGVRFDAAKLACERNACSVGGGSGGGSGNGRGPVRFLKSAVRDGHIRLSATHHGDSSLACRLARLIRKDAIVAEHARRIYRSAILA